MAAAWHSRQRGGGARFQCSYNCEAQPSHLPACGLWALGPGSPRPPPAAGRGPGPWHRPRSPPAPPASFFLHAASPWWQPRAGPYRAGRTPRRCNNIGCEAAAGEAVAQAAAEARSPRQTGAPARQHRRCNRLPRGSRPSDRQGGGAVCNPRHDGVAEPGKPVVVPLAKGRMNKGLPQQPAVREGIAECGF